MLEKTGWIIFRYKAGSHSYGTNIETSDIDYRGIFITPLKERITIKNLIPEVGQEKPVDIKYYELEKFFNLAKGCNPNIVEFLFSPKDCIEYCHPKMQKIIDNRHLFISKRAFHTFSAYAFTQCKKAKGKNKWVNNPKPKERPEKESYCFYIPFNGGSAQFPGRPIPLPETNLDFSNYRVAKLEHVANIFRLYSFPNDGKVFDNGDIVCTSIPFEKEKDFAGFLIFNKEQFKIDKDDWESYWTWVKERNPNRWVAQEKKEADYDSKNMLHTIRLLWSGENILRHGEPIVRFEGEQLKFLRNIRENKFSYEFLMEMVEEKMKVIEDLSKTSKLSWEVDIDKIDELFKELIMEK